MNEELILRNYLFHFLRSTEYKTDVNFYLPKFLANDPAFSETQRVLSAEHEKYRLKVIDFAKQFHPQTATWGLKIWEEELGLTTDLNLDLEPNDEENIVATVYVKNDDYVDSDVNK